MPVLTFLNQKGGVGKTTLSVHLAYDLAKRHPTLLIDLDPQGNATSIFCRNPQTTLFDHYENRTAHPIIETHARGLDLVPASSSLARLERRLGEDIDGYFYLKEFLEQKGKSYRFTIIDTPPNLGPLVVATLVASSDVLIPMLASTFSYQGLLAVLQTIETVKKRYNSDLCIRGAILMQSQKTQIQQALQEAIQGQIPLLGPAIPRTVQIEEAHLLKKTIFDYRPKSKAALTMKELFRNIEKILLGTDEPSG